MRDASARDQRGTETEAKGPGLRVPFSGDEPATPPAARARIARLVAAKLMLDLLFVAALAAYTHADTLRPPFSGSLEHADARSVRGWVVDRTGGDEPVEVQLYVDGRFVASTYAGVPRPGAPAGPPAPGGRKGFVFELDPPLYGEHEARVYALRSTRGGSRRSLSRIGGPLAFVSR